jgi:hypothetical protein
MDYNPQKIEYRASVYGSEGEDEDEVLIALNGHAKILLRKNLGGQAEIWNTNQIK